MNKFYKSMPSYDEVFTYDNLLAAYDKCVNTVQWKTAVIKYDLCKNINLYKLHLQLQNRLYTPDPYTEFVLMERGKIRNIKAPSFQDRIVQRCLCDNYLVPLLSRNLIYDNSATIKNRGTEFAIRRLKNHLINFHSKYGTDGYVLIFDFKDYFNSIDHSILYEQILDPKILDNDLKNIFHLFIDSCGDKGLGLGSQISQICAVSYPNMIDHTFKDHYGIKYYGRYMDDGYIISDSKEKLLEYKEDLFKLCNELKIEIHPEKVRISKINKNFTFLKKRIFVTDTGKIIVKLSRQSLASERQRIKKHKHLLEKGQMTIEDVIQSYKSWRGWAKKFNNYKSLCDIDKRFMCAFNEYFRNSSILSKQIFE